MCGTKQRYRSFKRAWRAANWHVRTACLKCRAGLTLRPYRCPEPGHGCHLGHSAWTHPLPLVSTTGSAGVQSCSDAR
jgi:hypothetical protein